MHACMHRWASGEHVRDHVAYFDIVRARGRRPSHNVVGVCTSFLHLSIGGRESNIYIHG